MSHSKDTPPQNFLCPQKLFTEFAIIENLKAVVEVEELKRQRQKKSKQWVSSLQTL